MQDYTIPNTNLSVSRIAYGCAGLASWDRNALTADDVYKAECAIQAACDNGITLFDHADVYAYGKAEAVFGRILKQSSGLRNKIVLQSKCGQRFPEGGGLGDPIKADLTREHIICSVEEILQRLATDHLDILLLHVADALMVPEEVAAAFEQLFSSGKVRYFGVSNHHGGQIELLKKSIRQPIIVNQIRVGLAHPDAIADGMEFTLQLAQQTFKNRCFAATGSGTMDYCRLNRIQIQAYSPLRWLMDVTANAAPEQRQTVQLLTDLAHQKDVAPSAIALAWLLRHPAGVVPIVGSINPQRIAESCAADRVVLSRDEWYTLFAAAAKL